MARWAAKGLPQVWHFSPVRFAARFAAGLIVPGQQPPGGAFLFQGQRLGRLRLVHRNDRPRVFRQQVTEAEDGTLLVLDVVRGGRVDVRVTQHLLRGRQSKAAVDLRAVFLSQRVQRGARDDSVRAQPREQRADLVSGSGSARRSRLREQREGSQSLSMTKSPLRRA